MNPTKSNTADKGCSPVSSNCVIWQGPNLSCINLCNGDTVSDVTYKLAVELCNLQAELDLSDLDLKCVVQACTNCPEPEKTLSAVLGLLIDKVCELSDILDSTNGNGTDFSEPILTLPSCLQYSNAQGQTITNLQHSNYTLTLAQKICQINSNVNNHTSQIADHETRIGLIEAAGDQNLPTVTPNCILPSQPTAMNTVLDELENQFCQMRGTVGTTSAITAAIAQQCTSLSASNALGQAGVMGTIPGWKTNVTTLSDSIHNLWLTVCDMRTAIANGVSSGGGSCADFLLSFTAAANAGRTSITLFFNNGTALPAGYSDCTQQGSKVTIADSNGVKYTGYVVLSSAISDTDGITFDISGANLNTSLNYTVTVEGCISNGMATCSKTATQTLSVACSVVTGVTATLV